MNYPFFALHARMKNIDRWALMRNCQRENLSEHSNDVAVIAHALAVIKNIRYEGNINAERVAFLALYHDMPEIMTGDMPTPIKYHNDAIRNAFAEVENQACENLLQGLPEDLQGYYKSAFFKQKDDEYLWKIVKAADKISALIKCTIEMNMLNREFEVAYRSIKKAVLDYDMPEVNDFLEDFFECFRLSLDEQHFKPFEIGEVDLDYMTGEKTKEDFDAERRELKIIPNEE